MKVRDPIYLAIMLALSGLGVIIGLTQGDSIQDTLVFVIFAMTMLYMGIR